MKNNLIKFALCAVILMVAAAPGSDFSLIEGLN